MKFSRRDLLVWGAGAAAGLMITPVPWKVLDDVSIWSQNWPWIPQPARGPVEVKQSFCTLCPKGCGLRVRIASGWPAGVAGLKTHPISRGALCPLAFGAHQLNWHPKRLRAVCHKASSSSWEAAQTAFAKAYKEGPVVVIDGYPVRAVSSVLESFAEKHGGEYRVVFGAEARSLTPYEKWSGVPVGSLGYDMEGAKTILSFGAPLLDGWGVPGQFTRVWAEKAAGASNPELRLIQVESALSRTGARAWQWVQIQEGSDWALAAGLARALMEQNLVPAHGPIPRMSMEEAVSRTGVSVDAIKALARTIVEQRPTVIIAQDANPVVSALNVLLGAVGVRGGIIRSTENRRPRLAAVPEIPNARAVVIDASVPWDFIPRTDAEVFRFAAWDGGSSSADWLLPAPGFVEETTDVPTAPASAVESYAIATSLVKPISDVRSAAQFLTAVDSSLVPAEKVIQQRCLEIYQKRNGSVYSSGITPVSEFASAAKFEEELRKGAVWVAQASPPGQLRCELKEWPAEARAPRKVAWDSSWDLPVLPTLASKLYVESTLRECPARRNA
jgi:hypothetical protein